MINQLIQKRLKRVLADRHVLITIIRPIPLVVDERHEADRAVVNVVAC